MIFCDVTHESDILEILELDESLVLLSMNIHNRALGITCERTENEAYYPAYVLIIEACKEIQD